MLSALEDEVLLTTILRRKGRRDPLKEPAHSVYEVVDTFSRFHEAKRLLDQGVVKNRAELARFLGVSRARITQLMELDRLDPQVWEWLEKSNARPHLSERVLRAAAAKPTGQQLVALQAWARWNVKPRRVVC